MKTKAVRMYGKNDLRLVEFELPEMGEGEIFAKIVTDSICMSTYKASVMGTEYKRVPRDIAENPTIIGHEFCGEIIEVGARWRDKYAPGERFAVQVALNLPENLAKWPGFSFPYVGGDAEYVIIPACVMEQDCLLRYDGDDFFSGSLSEPMSCIVGTFKAMFHSRPGNTYEHDMGIREGGLMALLGAAGPMGLGSLDLALHGERNPSVIVVTDIDDARLARAAAIYTPERAAKRGIELYYVNPHSVEKPNDYVINLAGGKFDDIITFAAVREVTEMGDRILADDGCLNFFAGPTDRGFTAEVNFYDVHYAAHHLVGTSGGNTQDMRDSLDMMAAGTITPASMITHIGGLNAVVDTTLNLPHIPGGKKLIYTHADLPLTAIADFAELGKSDPLFAALDAAVRDGGGLWNAAAEKVLLEYVGSRELVGAGR
jgi:threonine dehydrogenase-like Zn-dependent dehydrogenase